MQKRLFQLMIKVDRKCLVLKKNTDNAYKYINKIPCKWYDQYSISDAEEFVQKQLKQYQNIKNYSIMNHTYSPQFLRKFTKQVQILKHQQKQQVSKIDQLVDVLQLSKMNFTIQQLQKYILEIESDLNGNFSDREIQLLLKQLEKKLKSKLIQI